jgi:hypothetical protein
MTAVLRNLPYRGDADEVSVGLERIPILPYQIIIWVSVTARTVLTLPPSAPRIPAILDLGHNHNFSIQERHLAKWARLSPQLLPQRGAIIVAKKEIPLYFAAVWIHPNRPGYRDEFADQSPYRLELREGIAVYPASSEFPRLPLIGLRALGRNKLHLVMDPERKVVHLRTPDWRTKLLRWLM